MEGDEYEGEGEREYGGECEWKKGVEEVERDRRR